MYGENVGKQCKRVHGLVTHLKKYGSKWWTSLGELEFHAAIAMKIWFRRNTVVHRGEFLHPNILIKEVEIFLKEYRVANAEETVPMASQVDLGPNK
jgi:hypothetical protein